MFFGHSEEVGTFSALFDALQDSSIAGAVASPVLSVLFAVALLASGQNSTITGTLTGQVVMEGFIHMKILYLGATSDHPWLIGDPRLALYDLLWRQRTSSGRSADLFASLFKHRLTRFDDSVGSFYQLKKNHGGTLQESAMGLYLRLDLCHCTDGLECPLDHRNTRQLLISKKAYELAS